MIVEKNLLAIEDTPDMFSTYLEIYMHGLNEDGLKQALRLALGTIRDKDVLLNCISEWGKTHTFKG